MAQTMLDSLDPINFTAQVRAPEANPPFWFGQADPSGTDRDILFQQVVGANPITYDLPCDQDPNGCPDLVVQNNVYGPAFGPAWGFISGSGQESYLPGQFPLTTPVALSGTDPLVQGTAFISLAQAVQREVISEADPLTDLGMGAFFGIGLEQVGTTGNVQDGGGSGVVRYLRGEHSSLLNPEADLAVTILMQTQMAGFLSQGVIAPATTDGLVRD